MGRVISENLVCEPDDHVNKFNTLVRCADSIYMQPIDVFEVGELISALDSNKGPGPDEISAKTLKVLAPVIAPVLAHAINCSFFVGFLCGWPKTGEGYAHT